MSKLNQNIITKTQLNNSKSNTNDTSITISESKGQSTNLRIIDLIKSPVCDDNQTLVLDKGALKTIYNFFRSKDVEELVFDNVVISKDAETYVYLDKITSSENPSIDKLSFINIQQSSDHNPPYSLVNIFAKSNFLEPVRFVNIKIFEILNCIVELKIFYNMIKMTEFNYLKEFISGNVQVKGMDADYFKETIGLFKECLDKRSAKIILRVMKSDFNEHLSNEENEQLYSSIKDHPNANYYDMEESNLSGESQTITHD